MQEMVVLYYAKQVKNDILYLYMDRFYFHSTDGVFLLPDGYFTSSASQVITNLSCSLEFTTFEESCKFDFTKDEVCLNHTMDLILQCFFGRLWI